MTRSELIQRIRTTQQILPSADDANQMRVIGALERLVEDIEADGVLDVQCPEDIAVSMNLPRPAGGQ